MKEYIKRFCESLKKQEDIDLIRDTKAVAVGVKNFNFINQDAEQLANERFEKSCKNCAFNIHEPIEELRVNDKRIPELSERTCGECGCVLSYKLRQSVKKCGIWQR